MNINEHEHLEQRLRERRDLLAGIIGSAMDAIIAVDDAQRIVLFNTAAEKIFACEADEAVGSPVERFIPERFRAGHSTRVRRFGESGVTNRTLRGLGTLWGLRATGEEFPIEASVSKVESGGRKYFTVVIRDITERKMAEEALRSSEERLRLAHQAARIGTFERDVRTGRMTWSEGLEPIYGLSPGSLEGKTLSFFNDLVHPADRERAAHLIQQALKTGQPTEGEWRAIWPDGSVHWIVSRWQVLMDDAGEPLRVVGVNMDISERKQAEQAVHDMNRVLNGQAALLQSREELLKTFVKNVPVGVAMFDREMRYLQVSDRWCTDYAVDYSHVIGRSHYEVFPDMPERWKEVHRRALAGETLRVDEDRWDREGGTTWVRWEVRPWKIAAQTVGGILILAEDITRRKQAEEAASGMTRKLMEAQEQERTRVARELHDDINQRLAMLSLELEQLQDPSEFQNRVQGFRKELRQISDDVQALSHDLHSAKLEYLGVVAGMKSWCKEIAERQKMDVDFRSDVRSVLSLDVGRPLFRVLQEALLNAVKHSRVKRIEVQLGEDSGEIHLIVSDSGRGFDVEAALQGKGLGLTSMRERVRLVNGAISIESKPMGGTTIHVRVPLESGYDAQRAAG